MYRNILVPLDGSKTARCAFDDVRSVAAGRDTEIVLLMAAEPVPGGLYQSSGEGLEKLLEWCEQTLAEEKEHLSGEGLNVSTAVVKGKPAEVILDYATENSIDLIVMSTHGRSGPSRWAFGSVADKVIRKSTVPVLISVPQGCRLD